MRDNSNCLRLAKTYINIYLNELYLGYFMEDENESFSIEIYPKKSCLFIELFLIDFLDKIKM